MLTAVILRRHDRAVGAGTLPVLGYPELEPVGFSFMYKVLVIGLVAGAGAPLCRAAPMGTSFREGCAA